MENAVQTQYRGDGNFQVGNEVVSEKDLAVALERAGGPAGLFAVNGSPLTLEKAAAALRILGQTHGRSADAAKVTLPAPNLNGIADTKLTDGFLALMMMQLKTGETQLETSKSIVEQNRVKTETLHGQKMEKLNERIEDLEKAAAKEKKAGVWGKIAKAFEIIGAAIAVAIGAALVATGVGAAAGVAMMVVGTLLIANSIADLATGGNALAKGLEAAGMDPKVAAGIAMGLTIALNVALMVASGGGSAAITATSKGAGAAGNVVAAATKAGANVAQAAAKAEKLVSVAKQLDVAVKIVNNTSNIVGAVGSTTTAVGAGANNISSAVSRRDAELAAAAATEIAKAMKMVQQMNDEETEMIQQIVEQVNDTMSRIMSILSGINESQNNIAAKLGAMA